MLESEAYLEFTPSQVAAAALAIAKYTVGVEFWDEKQELETGYTLLQMVQPITAVYNTFKNAPKYAQQAIREKYKDKK